MSAKRDKKNILVCVSGLTPQIVTETLFCLAVKEKKEIDEIYVLTTKRGRDVILGKDSHPATPKTPLKKEIDKLCQQYKIKKPLFAENDKHIIVAREESIELSDIRSDKDNILFPNKISEFLRKITSKLDNTLYCSITGGRKSMNVHLANGLSLFAREDDKLLHVLTKEEHEFKGFFPQTKEEINDLELSEIPFVRLRPFLPAEFKGKNILKSNFDEIVNYTQKQLKALSPFNKLIIDVGKRELRYGNERILLQPMEFLFYYYFVDCKERGEENISIQNFQSDETIQRMFEHFKELFPSRQIERKQWNSKKFDQNYFLQRRSKINNKIEKIIDDEDIADLFKISVNRKWGSSTYFIRADMSKFKIINFG